MILNKKERASEFEKLLELYQTEGGKNLMSENQRLRIERMELADNLLRKYHTKPEVANMLINRYNVSRATAYRDLDDSQQLFNISNDFSKQYWRSVLVDWVIDNMKLARRKDNFREVNSAQKNLMALLGLDKDDKENIDPALLQQHIYQIGLPAEAMQFLQMMLQGGAIDLNKVREKQLKLNTEDTEAEVIGE
jgi:hypothetical protein